MGHGDAWGVYLTCNEEIRWDRYPYGPPTYLKPEGKLDILNEQLGLSQRRT